jgi:RimJ/RimL family protein N-acetyltransferase
VNVPVLEGRQVRLGPLEDRDSDTLFAWINDRELVVLSSPFAPVHRAAHDAWFQQIRKREDTAIFAIRMVDGDRLVGSCQLHSIDRTHDAAELQIRLGERDVWGMGLGTEAVELLLDYGFAGLGLHRICLHVLAGNERARHLYAGVGFREEGVLREAAMIDGRRTDLLIMGKLETDDG